MAYTFQETLTLIAALKKEFPVPTFLRGRYCPDGMIFDTTRVMLQFKEGDRRLAPAVSVRKGSVPVDRSRFDAMILEPPHFGVHRTTTLDDLEIKGFAEALYQNLTIEQRKRALALLDAQELREFIMRREEWLVARMMQDNEITLTEIIDDKQTGNEVHISYYPGEVSNPAVFSPLTSWDNPTANILADIGAAVSERKRQGLATTDVLMAPGIAGYLLENEQITKMRDKNFDSTLARIDPRALPNEATYFGTLRTPDGDILDFLTYFAQYEDEDGKIVDFMDEGKIVLCAPKTATMNWGAVKQKDEAGNWRTYRAKYVPRNTQTVDEDADKARLVSRPVPCPVQKNAFTSATVLF